MCFWCSEKKELLERGERRFPLSCLLLLRNLNWDLNTNAEHSMECETEPTPFALQYMDDIRRVALCRPCEEQTKKEDAAAARARVYNPGLLHTIRNTAAACAEAPLCSVRTAALTLLFLYLLT